MESNKWTRYEVYNLARAGTLRRELAIVNPIAYWQVAKLISSRWRELKKASNTSPLSLTKPVQSDLNRALARGNDIGALPYARAKIRSTGKYVLQADISNFYGSIYTHSAAWAIHGKARAKKQLHNKKLLGNKLDSLFRCLQDGQSVGLPVGPDASLLFAEIVSAAIDREVFAHNEKGIRYIDDYEVVFDLEDEAVRLRSGLQVALARYHLSLNPLKTRIARLPEPIDEGWTREVRRIISRKIHVTKGVAVDYFDNAFRLSETYPSAGVLKFAIGKLTRKVFAADAVDLIDDLLIQSARVEPGCLPFVATILLRRPRGSSARLEKVSECLSSIIKDHAPQRHSSEVAWALWILLSLRITIDADIVPLVLAMEDSVCALLLIEASKRDLLRKPNSLSTLRRFLSADDLYGSRWMLAYEAIRRGWLMRRGQANYVAQDVHYNFLRQNDVYFFEDSRIGVIPQGLLPPPDLAEEEFEDEEESSEDDRVQKYSEGDFWEEWTRWFDDDDPPSEPSS